MKLSDIKVGEIYCMGLSKYSKKKVRVTHIHNSGGYLPEGYSYHPRGAWRSTKYCSQPVVCVEVLIDRPYKDVCIPSEIVMLWPEWEKQEKERGEAQDRQWKHETEVREQEKKRWKNLSPVLESAGICVSTCVEYGGSTIRLSLTELEDLCKKIPKGVTQ